MKENEKQVFAPGDVVCGSEPHSYALAGALWNASLRKKKERKGKGKKRKKRKQVFVSECCVCR
jgi:hypothetical protein